MHQFFQQFSRPQQPQAKMDITPEMRHNLMVYEICNNWEFVKDLYLKISKGEVDLVQPMEGDWINFLSANQIDINSYNSKEDFEKNYERVFAEQLKK